VVRQAQLLLLPYYIGTDSENPTFSPRIVNKTDICFSNEELGLLNKAWNMIWNTNISIG